MSKKTRDILIWVVTGAWICNFVVATLAFIFDFDFEPSRAINAAFALIIGSLFVIGRNGKNGNGGSSA